MVSKLKRGRADGHAGPVGNTYCLVICVFVFVLFVLESSQNMASGATHEVVIPLCCRGRIPVPRPCDPAETPLLL